ncbi:MAG: mucoidy inhibitor MuiA family protein, partial [candidate division WOR-3 bacterium]
MVVDKFEVTGIEVNSKVDSVVVYSDRVLVTRIAEISIEKGTNIVFTDLPGAIDDQSVRVKAKDLTIGEIQIKTGYVLKPIPRVKELQDKIKTLEIEDRSLNDELAVLSDKEKFLNSLITGSANIILKEINTAKVAPETWQQGIRFVADELMSSKKRKVEIELERQNLKEKIDALRQEFSDVRSIAENRKVIFFEVQPRKPGKYSIELSYIIYGANWWTYYDLRANPVDKKVEIAYFGKLTQNTGEDWIDTKITLSTGHPATGGAPPSPEPWYINLYRPPPQEIETAYRGKREMPSASKAAEDKLAPPVLEPAPPVETGLAIWYPLPGKYTIKSGDQDRKILIHQSTLDGEYEYLIIPRFTLQAYLMAKVKNTTGYLYLAGEAGTYVGDDFTGKVYFPKVAPDDTVDITFGLD